MNPRTIRLGFGTPALMGVPSRREQFALLEAALAEGIQHFDTSPYYGYGAVEPLLGEFLAAHGASTSVTTKFGIQPPPRVLRGALVMKAARHIAALNPGIRRLLSRGASKMVTQGAFDPAEAEKSLRGSLRQLRRDRVDFFLLHEPTLVDTLRPGLKEFLRHAATEGWIGHFGIGAGWERVREVIAHTPEFAEVTQFENPPPHDRVPLVHSPGRTVVTFGCVGPALNVLRAQCRREPETMRALRSLGLDLGDEGSIGDVLLARAVARNPDGIVLFATRNVSRLQRNVRAVRAGRVSMETVRGLETLLMAAGSAA